MVQPGSAAKTELACRPEFFEGDCAGEHKVAGDGKARYSDQSGVRRLNVIRVVPRRLKRELFVPVMGEEFFVIRRTKDDGQRKEGYLPLDPARRDNEYF